MSDNGSMPSTYRDDGVLARLVSQGDVAAFAQLYDRYAAPIHTMAAHLLGASEADEAVQEVFLLLWTRAGQYDATRGSFKSWFMTVARHRVIRELRSRSMRRRVLTADSIDEILWRYADASVDVEEQAWANDQAKTLASELGALPADQRRVLVLAYFGGLSQSDIAQHLDIPLGTVKKRTRLGMQKLRRALSVNQQQDRDAPGNEGSSGSPPAKARITDGL